MESLVNIPVMDNLYPTFPIAGIPKVGEAIYNKLCQLHTKKNT